MEIIKEIPLREGGVCAECCNSYTAFSGKRVLLEYEDPNKTFVTEPFNLCYKCYSGIKRGKHES